MLYMNLFLFIDNLFEYGVKNVLFILVEVWNKCSFCVIFDLNVNQGNNNY